MKHMNISHKAKPRQTFSLGELIAAVSACSRNEGETIAAVRDLFATGRVRFESPLPARARR